MPFLTKLDYSNNRQIKQNIETTTYLSGGTVFGVPFSQLPSGIDTSSTGVSETYVFFTSSFSGNSGTTIFNWNYPIMSIGDPLLSAITPSNSAVTQTVNLVFSANTTTVIDGNTIALTYTGVSYDVLVTGMTVDGSGNYSGSILTTLLTVYSGNSLDFNGRTIWVDVSGITRTNDLIINKTPVIGYVWVCSTSEGKGEWKALTGVTGYWSGGTGQYSLALSNYNSLVTGNYSISLGRETISSGDTSLSEGFKTIAGGAFSHAEGSDTIATGNYSHAEGISTIASNDASHAEGTSTEASGVASHASGKATIASGDYSFAGGDSSQATGLCSFSFGNASQATHTDSIVLGPSISSKANDVTHVVNLNIDNLGSGAFFNNVNIDANGFLTSSTSDINLKENIKSIKNSLDIIKGLSGVTYEWIDKSAGGTNPRFGFIAQQVEDIEPLLVFKNEKSGYKGVHTDCVIPIIVEAIKQLSDNNTNVSNINITTQTVVAEDNNIELNYNGSHESANGGGIIVINGVDTDKNSEFVIDKNGNWVTNTSLIPKELIIPIYTPSSSTDRNGVDGSITRDDNYLYIKTSNNWKRVALEDF